jgi:hypothetical protein
VGGEARHLGSIRMAEYLKRFGSMQALAPQALAPNVIVRRL